MVQSAAKSVEQYLAELPEPRRSLIARVRDMVNRHIPKGYRESMAYGMIGWGIPLERYPNSYNKQPLGYVALAAQKQYNTLYLMAVYADSVQERALRAAYAERGLKLDMGKCCLRFPDKAPPPEDLIGPLIASMSVEDYIATYEAARAAPKQKPGAKAYATSGTVSKVAASKAAASKAAASKAAASKAAASKAAASKAAASKAAASKAAASKAAASKAAASKAAASKAAASRMAAGKAAASKAIASKAAAGKAAASKTASAKPSRPAATSPAKGPTRTRARR